MSIQAFKMYYAYSSDIVKVIFFHFSHVKFEGKTFFLTIGKE